MSARPPSDATRCLRLRLHAEAARILERLPVVPAAPVEERIDDGATELTVRARPLRASAPVEVSADNPLLPFLFSPIELQALQVVAAEGHAKGGAIGRRIRQADASGQASAKLRSTLAGLMERQILANDDNGYFVTPEFAPLIASTLSGGDPPGDT